MSNVAAMRQTTQQSIRRQRTWSSINVHLGGGGLSLHLVLNLLQLVRRDGVLLLLPLALALLLLALLLRRRVGGLLFSAGAHRARQVVERCFHLHTEAPVQFSNR